MEVFAAPTAASVCLAAGLPRRKCSAQCQLQPLVWITCGCLHDERAAAARWCVYDQEALLHVSNQGRSW